MKRINSLALAALAATTLAAADFTGGLQLGPAFTTGDMKTLTDGKTGATLVLFGLWDLGGGHAVRARLDGTAASGKPQNFPTPVGNIPLNGTDTIGASTGTLGGDYLYYLQGSRDRGLYLGGGVGYTRNKVDLDIKNLGGTSLSIVGSEIAGSVGYGLYAGYQFNRNWSAELAFHGSQFKLNKSGLDFNYSMNSVSLVAGYTF
jgi:hypothetical protein